jgi:TrmH family RNA methyltransferase
MQTLEQIRIVMVNTSDSGNLGSAARAMKTMGFRDLCLVAPLDPPTTAKAVSRASGAADVLYHARVVDTLEDAIADCQLVVGASARLRTIPWPLLSPVSLGRLVGECPGDTRVAILFGREDSGLTNEELQRCHFHVAIPGNAEYSVLNVSQAIQVICYQLRQSLIEEPDLFLGQWGTATTPELDKGGGAEANREACSDTLARAMRDWDSPLATHADMERFHRHFEEVMLELDFLDPNNPRQLLTRVRRLFNRACLDHREVNVLRGILTAMQKRLRGSGSH